MNNFQTSMIQAYFNLQPSSVKGGANHGTEYFKRYLYTILHNSIRLDIPKEWAINFFRFWLYRYGSIAIIYTHKFGWICYPYGVEEYDIFYQPYKFNVTSHMLGGIKKGIVGVNGAIIKIMDDFYGLDDLVTHHAELLANIEKAININLMNCNVALLASAENNKEASLIKEAYSQATKGEPLVVVNKNTFTKDTLNYMIPNVKQQYIVGELLNAKRAILNNFLTRIGVRNANYEKRERLNSQEVNENNDETSSIIEQIRDNIQRGFDIVNGISNLKLRATLSYDYMREVAEEWEE